MEFNELMEPYIQYGFAGLCLIMFGGFMWLVKQLLGMQQRSNEAHVELAAVLSGLTSAIQSIEQQNRDQLKLSREIQLRVTELRGAEKT